MNTSNNKKIPVFPLGLVVLPGTIQSLQIFEPRYIDMVKSCMKDASGFVITLQSKSEGDIEYGLIKQGTYVEIIDFNNNPQSLIWPDRVESIRNLNDRIETMFDWIGQRRETRIAIVSHSSFIGQLKDKKIGDENNELKHCHPYKIVVNYSHNKKFISMREIKE